MKFRINAHAVQHFQPALHLLPKGNAVVFPYTGKRGWVKLTIFAISCILHDHRCGPRQIIAAKGRCSIRRYPCGHPAAGRAAPEGIVGGIHFQFFGMLKNKANGSGQIFASGLCAGTINQSKRVIAQFGKLQSVRKTILHGANICKPAACIAHSKLCTRGSFEKE